MKIIKKDGHLEDFDFEKIKIAVSKSASRIHYILSNEEWNNIFNKINKKIDMFFAKKDSLLVGEIHKIVEAVLNEEIPEVGKQYSNYRNYKKDYAHMMESVLKSADELNYHIDRSNANTSAALVSTKRSLVYTALNKELYKKIILSEEEINAIEDGYIYIHDLGARMDTYNCCLFDMGKVLQGGFEWEHIGYNEPKDVRTACNLISDITLNCAAQQYGGFTIPEIDSILAPYAEKSYKKHYNEYIKNISDISNINPSLTIRDSLICKKAEEYAIEKTKEELSQGFQGFEHTFNTVASSRGDYPFVTMTGGCEESFFGQLVWSIALEVRMNGQGHPGKKRPAIFPKLVFLYTKELHAKGKPLHDLFIKGVMCSSKAMYPDWLSLDEPESSIWGKTKTSLSSIFKKYHKFGISRWYLDADNKVQEDKNWVDAIVSPMGKRKLQLI